MPIIDNKDLPARRSGHAISKALWRTRSRKAIQDFLAELCEGYVFLGHARHTDTTKSIDERVMDRSKNVAMQCTNLKALRAFMDSQNGLNVVYHMYTHVCMVNHLYLQITLWTT